MNTVKEDERFTVVLGNPPYSSAAGAASTAFVKKLMKPFTEGLGVEAERKKGALQDEYVRFLALCYDLIARSKYGVLGLITNNSYIDGTLHRALRKALLDSFVPLRILNLHGSTRAGRSNVKDENVFEIKQGVAILTGAIAAKPAQATSSLSEPDVSYSELMGTRSRKYEELRHSSIESSQLEPTPPYYLLRPLDIGLFPEYEQFVSVDDAFATFSSGIETEKDHFAVDFDAAELKRRLEDFCDLSISSAETASRFRLRSTANWDLDESRAGLAKDGLEKSLFIKYLYRCFDWRYTYYSDWIITRPRRVVMRHMTKDNLALVCLRQVKGEPWAHVFVASDITNKFTLSSKSSNVSYHLPLFRMADVADSPARLGDEFSETETNLDPELLGRIAAEIGIPAAESADTSNFARRVFFYVYAVLNSPSFRSRYSEFLPLGFPRFPLPATRELFDGLAACGSELVGLHLMDSPKLDRLITTYNGPINPEVGRVSWSDETVWLDAGAQRQGQRGVPGTVGFSGVPEDVWSFHMGGYQVCHKWLKDRKGRKLSKRDVSHYQRMVVAMAETLHRMEAIDAVIEEHGGWPGAFQSVGSAEAPGESSAEVGVQE